jgi:acyl transferase domain-containing protein
MTMDAVAGTRTACYVASFTHDYAELLAQDGESQPRYKFTGCGAGMLANRISWFFDLQAPSVTVDTACSSSLVALHLGCQSIRAGDADMVRITQRRRAKSVLTPPC